MVERNLSVQWHHITLIHIKSHPIINIITLFSSVILYDWERASKEGSHALYKGSCWQEQGASACSIIWALCCSSGRRQGAWTDPFLSHSTPGPTRSPVIELRLRPRPITLKSCRQMGWKCFCMTRSNAAIWAAFLFTVFISWLHFIRNSPPRIQEAIYISSNCVVFFFLPPGLITSSIENRV